MTKQKPEYIPLWADRDIDWDNTERYDRQRHIDQRMERGFSMYDGWAFDSYIAAVISNYCKWLRKNDPAVRVDSWNKDLKFIQKTMAAYANGDFMYANKTKWKEYHKAMKLLTKHLPGMWT